MSASDKPASRKVWEALTTVMTRVDQAARIVVPDGQRPVLLVRGAAPALIADEPGEYELSADALVLDAHAVSSAVAGVPGPADESRA